jgi:hypothetical protein
VGGSGGFAGNSRLKRTWHRPASSSPRCSLVPVCATPMLLIFLRKQEASSLDTYWNVCSLCTAELCTPEWKTERCPVGWGRFRHRGDDPPALRSNSQYSARVRDSPQRRDVGTDLHPQPEPHLLCPVVGIRCHNQLAVDLSAGFPHIKSDLPIEQIGIPAIER